MLKSSRLWVGCGFLLVQAIAPAAPVSTAITYQGQLKDNGSPVNGSVEMSFRLFDDPVGGSPVGGIIGIPLVDMSGGLFSVELDFGVGVFDGDERYLEVTVAGNVLSPRQRIAPAAYALHALNGGGARNALDAEDGSPVDALFVDADGEVGIGTAAPGAALDIVDATGLSLRINDDVFVDGVSGFVGVGRSNRLSGNEVFGLHRAGVGFGGMYIQTPDASGMPFYGYHANGVTRGYHYFDTSGNWKMLVSGSDRWTITSTGDAGVGTTAPESKFHVLKGSAGTVTADANSAAVIENSTNAYLSILAPDANERGILFGEPSHNAAGGVLYNSGATPDGLQFRTNGNVVRMAIDAQGEVGIGTANPTAPLDVSLGSKLFQLRLDGGLVPGFNLTGTGGNLGILRIRNKIEMFPNDAGTAAASIDLRSATGTVNINLDGSAGHIDANGAVRVDGANTNVGTTAGGVLRFGGGNSGEIIASKRNAGGNQFGLDFYTGHTTRMVVANNGNVGIGTTSPAALLDVNGRTRTDSLEIVGGADLAEAFDVRRHEGTQARRHEGKAESGKQKTETSDAATKRRSDEGEDDVQNTDSHGAVIPEGNEAARQQGNEATRQQSDDVEPGTVVVIDPDHAGGLMVSALPYDARVAGIISGAKGLAPGMVLRSEGDRLADGKHLVAMTGRVWCKCDASTGAIRPGDLLTTSATPGHAMRVAADASVPRGAILGKAMTGLDEGTGLVLVLVNLQ